MSELGDDDGEGRDPDALFDAAGAWQVPPAQWGDPARALEQKRFMETLEKCNGDLPERLAQVFTLREVTGLTTKRQMTAPPVRGGKEAAHVEPEARTGYCADNGLRVGRMAIRRPDCGNDDDRKQADHPCPH